MSNMSEDIQYAGSDTRPLMLDKTDFESWKQQIRLYSLGKDNGENIKKSITEGPFQMGTLRETLRVTGVGVAQLGPERNRVFADLLTDEKEMYKTDIRATNILLQGNLNYTINLNTSIKSKEKLFMYTMNKATVQEGRVVVQDVRGRYNANNQRRPFQRNNTRGVVGTGNAGDYFKDKMLLMQAQENGVVLDVEQLLFFAREHVTNFDDDVDDPLEQDLALNVDHVFELDQCGAFNFVVDEYQSQQRSYVVYRFVSHVLHDTHPHYLQSYHDFVPQMEYSSHMMDWLHHRLDL
nr:hypothetical protein [Tanacetum cinerariifolium]